MLKNVLFFSPTQSSLCCWRSSSTRCTLPLNWKKVRQVKTKQPLPIIWFFSSKLIYPCVWHYTVKLLIMNDKTLKSFVCLPRVSWLSNCISVHVTFYVIMLLIFFYKFKVRSTCKIFLWFNSSSHPLSLSQLTFITWVWHFYETPKFLVALTIWYSNVIAILRIFFYLHTGKIALFNFTYTRSFFYFL